ncbi:hypothetical protein TI39_contig303g00019 [Zymoseptoria brevis]|uniref:Uncharacterized protein n=1 Tax=Zymoseptoria brevis TaxID=1047168 RepID=A0A0F4GY14_9PEZI|nr:hypothetical protein TI39_contig303g00019 [Zymoseptoria brevis]
MARKRVSVVDLTISASDSDTVPPPIPEDSRGKRGRAYPPSEADEMTGQKRLMVRLLISITALSKLSEVGDVSGVSRMVVRVQEPRHLIVSAQDSGCSVQLSVRPVSEHANLPQVATAPSSQAELAESLVEFSTSPAPAPQQPNVSPSRRASARILATITAEVSQLEHNLQAEEDKVRSLTQEKRELHKRLGRMRESIRLAHQQRDEYSERCKQYKKSLSKETKQGPEQNREFEALKEANRALCAELRAYLEREEPQIVDDRTEAGDTDGEVDDDGQDAVDESEEEDEVYSSRRRRSDGRLRRSLNKAT